MIIVVNIITHITSNRVMKNITPKDGGEFEEQ